MVIKCLNSGGGEVKRRSGGRLLSMKGGKWSVTCTPGEKM